MPALPRALAFRLQMFKKRDRAPRHRPATTRRRPARHRAPERMQSAARRSLPQSALLPRDLFGADHRPRARRHARVRDAGTVPHPRGTRRPRSVHDREGESADRRPRRQAARAAVRRRVRRRGEPASVDAGGGVVPGRRLVRAPPPPSHRLPAARSWLLSRIQFFAAHKDNHGEMAAGAKRLKLAAQREHDASGRLEELFQRGGHELLHRGAELLTRARGISDDRSPMSRGASYGAGGGAVDGGGGGGVSGDGSGGGCGSSAAAVEASASAAEAASHAAEGEEAAAPAGGRRFTLSDPMAC